MLDIAGYLRRLGLTTTPPPTLAGLRALHRAQVERIAYNTIDIHLGRRTSVDPAEAAARVVATGRGGYCFHLNGAFALLLEELGFDVRRHRGWVLGRSQEPGTPLEPWPHHLALTVHALPTPENPGGAWFVDAGLGDGLHEPVPLRGGLHSQGPFGFGLATAIELRAGWRFTHDPRIGSFAAMEFEAAPARTAQFRAAHRYLSTAPQSPFVQRVLAQRRDADGLDKLVGCTLTRVDAAGESSREVTDPDEWFAALSDVFSLTLEDGTPAERARLWQRAYESHLVWKGEP